MLAEKPILQYFESPYSETTDGIADVFMAGYGALPTGTAEGGQSVGYDVFDRFQLDSTLYGNGNQLKRSSPRRIGPASSSLRNTSGDRHTPSGFNLDHSLAGDPVEEKATGLLVRYCK